MKYQSKSKLRDEFYFQTINYLAKKYNVDPKIIDIIVNFQFYKVLDKMKEDEIYTIKLNFLGKFVGNSTKKKKIFEQIEKKRLKDAQLSNAN